MDFLVNPSTFSDAEMADILMQKLTKTSDERLYIPRADERFPLLFASAQKKKKKHGANCTTRSSSPAQVLRYSV